MSINKSTTFITEPLLFIAQKMKSRAKSQQTIACIAAALDTHPSAPILVLHRMRDPVLQRSVAKPNETAKRKLICITGWYIKPVFH